MGIALSLGKDDPDRTMPPAAQDLESDAMLAQKRRLVLQGRSEEAYPVYLEVIGGDPANLAALHELGCLSYADGYRSAARTLYQRIVERRPSDLVARCNLGSIFFEDGELAQSKAQYEAALAINPDFQDAHRGLGRVLSEASEIALAERHWRKSFAGQAVTLELYRGRGLAVEVLLLVSAGGGNIPTRTILSDRIFAVTTLYAEYYRPDLPLPPHDIVFNAIGDADLCTDALNAAERIVARTVRTVINPPARIRTTGRFSNARRLAGLDGVRVPRMMEMCRADIAKAADLGFPLLLRSPGFHTGRNFLRVDMPEELHTEAQMLPGPTLLAIEYLDARGPDGMARKYRVMSIGGRLYPMHLAVCANWKAHYFTSQMEQSAACRAEEEVFLHDMASVLGARAIAGLEAVARKLDLDYCGMDFALDLQGQIILFEANATMVIVEPPPEPIWDYRRAAVTAVLDAARALATRANVVD